MFAVSVRRCIGDGRESDLVIHFSLALACIERWEIKHLPNGIWPKPNGISASHEQLGLVEVWSGWRLALSALY